MASELNREQLDEKYGLDDRTFVDRFRENWTGYLFILPTLIGFVGLFYFPLLDGIRMSFMNYSIGGAGGFVGLENYVWVLSNDLFVFALGWTLVFVLATTVLQLSLGLFVATLVEQYSDKIRGVVAALLMSPFFSAALVGGVIWQWFLSVNFGVVSWVFARLGIEPIYFLSEGIWPYISLIVAQVWHDYAYAAIIYSAALANIPRDQYEAASLAGAGMIRRFRDITLPHLYIPTIIVLAMRTAFNFAEFAQPFALTGGGPGTRTTLLSILVYQTAFVEFRFGRAYVMGIVLMLLSIGASIIYIVSIKSEEEMYI